MFTIYRKHKMILAILALILGTEAAVAGPAPPHLPTNFSREQLNADVQNAFTDWLTKYLTRSPAAKNAYRVHMGKAYDYGTTSESIGLGMLILVLLDNARNHNQPCFDGLFAYYKNFLDSYGLMHWKIDKEGKIEKANSATEADENVALALIFAHKKWGSSRRYNYKKEALTLLANIKKYEIEPETFVVKPGDTWGGSKATNLIYHDTAFYPIFADFSADNSWYTVRAKSYRLLRFFYANYNTGLVPDWCTACGTPAENLDYTFSYNACQMPLKLAIEYLWYGKVASSRAFAGYHFEDNVLPYLMNYQLSKWMRSATGGDPQKIVDGYTLDGKATGKWHNASFVGPVTAAATLSPDFADWLNQLYAHLRSMKTGGDWGYYSDTLRLLSMMVVSGNFTNLYAKK